MDPFLERAEAIFSDALAGGLAPFLMPVSESTPVNATPYMVRYARFRHEAANLPGRGALLAELDALMVAVRRLNISVEAILLGGSFTELDKTAIGDIDCLLFYRLDATGGEGGMAELATIQRDARKRGIDARFVPLDGDPLVMIKLTSYFTILYSKRKGGLEIVRGLLLLDCRQDGAQDATTP